MIRQATTLLIICSFFPACGDMPDTNICIVNAPNKNRKCYNLKNDYNSTGQLKAGVVPQYRSNVTIDDLDKAFCVDPVVPANNQGLANLKTWIGDLIKANQ